MRENYALEVLPYKTMYEIEPPVRCKMWNNANLSRFKKDIRNCIISKPSGPSEAEMVVCYPPHVRDIVMDKETGSPPPLQGFAWVI